MAIQGRREGVAYDRTPDGRVVNEIETFTCGHCQHVTARPPGVALDDLGRFCLACQRPCCKVCAFRMANGWGCEPFEKKLEAIEGRAVSRRSFERAMS